MRGKLALLGMLLGAFALSYILGSLYWYFIGSLNVYSFVASAAVFGALAVALLALKRYVWAVGLAGALLAMFTATYWVINLVAALRGV